MSEARFSGPASRCAPYLLALALLPACQPASGDAPGPGAPPATVEETDRTVFLDDGVVRVGIDKRWGGAIRELRHGGRDLVNAYDGGRLAWVSLYDAADGFDVELDASGLAPGEHALTVALRDAAGDVQLLGPRSVVVE